VLLSVKVIFVVVSGTLLIHTSIFIIIIGYNSQVLFCNGDANLVKKERV
jgi:hypothetical protein